MGEHDRPRRLAVFVTRDGYISAALLDAIPERITMTTKSMDIARHGHALDYTRISPHASIPALYEEDAPAEAI